MPAEPEDFSRPFQDEEIRKTWLDVLEYLEDDELPTMTYRSWLEVAKDTAFESLSDDLNELFTAEEALVRYNAFNEWFGRLQTEQRYLNRRHLSRTGEPYNG